MTVSSEVSFVSYGGDGTTTTFPVPYYFLRAADLVVTVINADGTTVPYALDAAYTVTGAGSQNGGSITTTGTPVPNGKSIQIERDPPVTQETAYQANDPFPAAEHEKALDKLTMISQRHSRIFSNSLHFPLTETTDGALPKKSERAGMLLGFDPVGQPIMVPESASIGAGDMRVDTFVSGVDFTTGITTQLTLSRPPGNPANLEIFFDPLYQGPDQWNLLGSVVTFTSPIPGGVSKVFARIGTTLSTEIPPDQSVTDAKVAIGSALENRITHIYDPMDPKYGCKFDGVYDDAPGFNLCLTDAANTGGLILLPQTGTMKINSPLVCKTTVQLAAALPGSALYLSDMRTVSIWSPGRCTIKAGAAMTRMLTFTFNAAMSNIAPYFSSVEGVVFDGNNLATNGLFNEWTTRCKVERCTFANMAGFGLSNLGYGVAQYLHNTFLTHVGIQVQQGGDIVITANDFYSPPGSNGHIGIDMQGWSGNTHIHENTFTADATSSNETPILLNGNIPIQAGREIRDVTIRDNEISGYDLPISGVAASNNIYNCIVEGNHKTTSGPSKKSAALIALTGANQIIVSKNVIGNDAYSTLTGNAISFSNCARMAISANKFTNLQDAPMVLVNVVQSKVFDNEFYDYGKGNASNPAIYLDSTSTSNEFYGNTYNQSNAAYGQLGIAEHVGCNNNYAHDEKFVGVGQPYLVIGANSRLLRKEVATAAPTSGYYNPGDEIVNPAPSLARNISHWKCISGGNPAAFTAIGCGSGNTAQRPALVGNDFGYTYRDTTTGLLIFWDGAAWQAT